MGFRVWGSPLKAARKKTALPSPNVSYVSSQRSAAMPGVFPRVALQLLLGYYIGRIYLYIKIDINRNGNINMYIYIYTFIYFIYEQQIKSSRSYSLPGRGDKVASSFTVPEANAQKRPLQRKMQNPKP